MPTCSGVILWHTVYLLAIVFKQILITTAWYVQVGLQYMFRLRSRSLGILLDLTLLSVLNIMS